MLSTADSRDTERHLWLPGARAALCSPSSHGWQQGQRAGALPGPSAQEETGGGLLCPAHGSPTSAAPQTEHYATYGLPAAEEGTPWCLGFSFSPTRTALLTPFPAIKADKSKQREGLGFLTVLPKENAGSCLSFPSFVDGPCWEKAGLARTLELCSLPSI